VLIQNAAASLQTVSTNGGLTLTNSGAGNVALTSAGAQSVSASFADVSTAAGATGNARLSSTGNQRIHTTNQNGILGLRVAALGSGTASIDSGASQLLEVTYPEAMTSALTGAMVIGNINAAGVSRVTAVDQSVFAGSLLIQSGASGSISELSASASQAISTLKGGLSVLGGSGNNTLAQIDPVAQSIVANGGVTVQGGTGTNAVAQILAGSGTTTNGQAIYATNGNVALTGGGAGSAALITNTGFSSLVGTSGNITLTAGTLPGADAIISVANGPGVLTLLCGGTCALAVAGTTPTAGIIANQPPSSTSSTASSLNAQQTDLVVALQQDQAGTLADTQPAATESSETDDASGKWKAPICQ
jgi:hypothetical protein